MRDKRAKLTKAQRARARRAAVEDVSGMLARAERYQLVGFSDGVRPADAEWHEAKRLLRAALAAVRADRGPRR